MQSWQEPRLPTLLPVQKRGWDLLSSPNLSHVLSHTDVIVITIVDSYAISHLQGIFHTQESNPGLLHCRWILYQLNHKGSPRTLEWVAYPFASRSSKPRNQTKVFYIAGGWILYQLSYDPPAYPAGFCIILKPHHCK